MRGSAPNNRSTTIPRALTLLIVAQPTRSGQAETVHL